MCEIRAILNKNDRRGNVESIFKWKFKTYFLCFIDSPLGTLVISETLHFDQSPFWEKFKSLFQRILILLKITSVFHLFILSIINPFSFSYFIAIGIESVPSEFTPSLQQQSQPQYSTQQPASSGYPPSGYDQYNSQPQQPQPQYSTQQQTQLGYPPQSQQQSVQQQQQEPIHMVVPSLWGNRESPRVFRLNQPFSFTICAENVKPEQVFYFICLISNEKQKQSYK